MKQHYAGLDVSLSETSICKSGVMLDNHLHGILKAFGLKVGEVDAARLKRRVRELVDGDELLKRVVGPILAVRQETVRRLDDLHGLALAAVKADPVCRLLVTVPGVVRSLRWRSARLSRIRRALPNPLLSVLILAALPEDTLPVKQIAVAESADAAIG